MVSSFKYFDMRRAIFPSGLYKQRYYCPIYFLTSIYLVALYKYQSGQLARRIALSLAI